ncbi:uroporphyrinogen decarboxylase [Alphaproteobacteria bacterium]|nr:uroporphyrinogen decarboxylase [Alphaproteobacteria bacterium]
MPNQLLMTTLKGGITKRPPFWFMRQAGRYLPEYREIRKKIGTFMDLCLNPQSARDVTLQPIIRYNTDAAILFSDILIIPYGLGMDVRFEEGKGPVLGAISNSNELNALSLTKNWTRIEATYETVSLVKTKLPDTTSLIGFAGSPWTVATYMVEGRSSKDYAKVKGWAYRDPDGFSRLIELLVEATVKHLSKQISAGADVVKLFDSWAGVLSPVQFKKWVIDPTKKICQRLKKRHPHIMIIGFPKGAGVGYKDYVEQTGVDAVSIDTSISTSWAAQELQTKIPIQGNLDPISLLEGGSQMIEQAGLIVEDLKNGPFIFNLGHGILPNTPVENVAELVAFLQKSQ